MPSTNEHIETDLTSITQTVTHNERAILSLLWKNSAISRSEVCNTINLTQQSIHRILNGLQEKGAILFSEPKPTAAKGKPSPQVALNESYVYSFGVSLETDSLAISLMNFKGINQTKSFFCDSNNIPLVLQTIEKEMNIFMEEYNICWHQILGIGFAMTGYLNEGKFYNPPQPLFNWANQRISPLLKEKFNKPIWVDNSANTSTLCELMFGLGQEVSHFAYLACNYGFGGGIVINGEVFRGGFGNAGEYSGIYTKEETIYRPTMELLLKKLRKNNIEINSIFELSNNFNIKWPGVSEWLDMTIPQFNRVYNVISATIDPKMIIIGGLIPDLLAKELIKRVESYQMERHGSTRPMPVLKISQLKDDTASIGAALLPLKATFY